jgi:OLD-like protein/putative AbiEii toxin of type IV toxin-antitoxin system
MPFPITVTYVVPELFGGAEHTILLNGGLTTFVGPNGSGKSQVLRLLKTRFPDNLGNRKIRYLTAGRLYQLEQFRSDFDGQRGGGPMYESASLGGKGSSTYRHQAETAVGDFHTLSIRPDLQVKVFERLRALFKRNVYIDWDAGNLTAKFERTTSPLGRYTFSREASGLLQLVVNLAALYDDEVGVLLIDEPEISLHPQLQSFLLREIHRVAGDPVDPAKKIVVIATHSSAMIDIRKPEDLTRVVFFIDADTPPSQISPAADELKSAKIKSLLARLGEVHKDALFSSQPLLVEGPSDAIICSALDISLDLYLSAAGSHIVPVIGKGQFPVVVNLFRLAGKSPIVLADLDAIADGLELVGKFANNAIADRAVQKQGHKSLRDFARTVHTDFASSIEKHWDDISEHASLHSYWTKRDPDKDETIARRRAAMAVILSDTEENISTWPNGEVWLRLRLTISALLDFLETTGCFILRKGTIESYYQDASALTISDKPLAAAQEAKSLIEKDSAFIERSYEDILRALRFASTSPQIDEASAVALLLLSVAAPALMKLDKDISDLELASIAMNVLGDRASMFDFKNISSERDELTLYVGLKSTVLDIEGLPIELRKGSNLVEEVRSKIGRKAVDNILPDAATESIEESR